VHTPGEEPKNFSGYVRGGVHKLVDPTLVSVDAEWDYTVGLADYLACACATPHVPRDRAAYQAYRRTLVPFEEAESIALAAHKGLMLSEEKIKRLCVLGDLLLCSDLCLLRVFAAAIGSEDLRAALGVQRVHSPSRHTSHVTRHTSHVTRHTSHVTRHTSHVTRHTSHVTRHTSHVTRHTSHVTRHTSHATAVPEWTRCHGVLVPNEAALFHAGGGNVETWRRIFERVSCIQVTCM